MDNVDDEPPTDAADVFAALGDPVRVGVLEALAVHHRRQERTAEPGLAFSTLRKRVGVRDSGRFRYHLEKLRGTFVEQADDGTYRLTYAGNEVVTAIVAGTYTTNVTRGPTTLDSTCDICERQAVGTYDDGVLAVSCRNDHPLFFWSLPPNAARDATVGELIETATLDLYQTIELTRSGTCPDCYTPISTCVEQSEGPGQAYRFRASCGACGSTLDGPIGFCLIGHPEVESLYHRHDCSIREGYWWELEFMRDDLPIDQSNDDPLRLQLSVQMEQETLHATINDAGRVASTELTTDE
jgi:DNA-binding transcriptional ArsR family regulator